MKMMNKVCALMLSAALCAGMAVPAFAYGGDVPEEVEQPILTAASDEEDSITVTDEETGALTPEGNLSIVDVRNRCAENAHRQLCQDPPGLRCLPESGI